MAPSGGTASKRKAGPHSNQPPNRSAKRVKAYNARTILAQSSDKALSKEGNLDVAAFVKAREFEIKAMEDSMRASKSVLANRAFQQIPKSMRRRTASHNVKRVPKRLRARAAKERLRLEKAKQLQKRGALTRKQRARKKHKSGETDPDKTPPTALRLPKLKKGTLSQPARPRAKFRKRQIHKSWLPTHIYHAKRAHMTEPKSPLWRFAVSLTPTEKCFRTTHRASNSRGCVAWDMSYMGTIGLEGVEASLLNLLRSVGFEDTMLTGKTGARWRKGTRGWEGWLRERDGGKRWTAPVRIIWCADDDAKEHLEEIGQEKEKNKTKAKRKLLIRVHPSAFLEMWNEILKIAKIQRPQVMVEDLRFEIGSIEMVGPGSTEALIGALHPTPPSKAVAESPSGPIPLTANSKAQSNSKEDWVDIETPEKIWPQLASLTNPASLPANAVLGFEITDPRLQHPPRTVSSGVSEKTLLNLICSWPPDQSQSSAALFSRTARLTASRLLSSQKAINRRKTDAMPGSYPDPSPKDPKIPILLLASRSAKTACQGSWTLLLPWDCVLPVWYSLMHYPLSTGGNARLGALLQRQQISFEQGTPWFPGDFPGTRAGWAWELLERERAKADWEKRPKGKRCEWESLDLGDDRKGEIGMGWACDWEKVVEGSPRVTIPSDQAAKTSSTKPAESAPNKIAAVDAGITTKDEAPPRPPPLPPLNITHIPNPLTTTLTASAPGLTPIHLTILTTGHPARCARIYRFPTNNPHRLSQWRDLAASVSKSTSKNDAKDSKRRLKRPDPPSASAPAHEKAQHLVASLLHPPLTRLPGERPKPGDQDYPSVPDEVDLIGFVTMANYQLGAGKCEAFGNVVVGKVLGEVSEHGNDGDDGDGDGDGNGGLGGKDDGKRKGGPAVKRKPVKEKERLCVVRNAGQSLGRLARWKFV